MYNTLKILSGDTAGTETQAYSIVGKHKVTFVVSRTETADGSAGYSTFKLQVRSRDDAGNTTGWIDYDKSIQNIANTNAQTITRITTLQIDAPALGAGLTGDVTTDFISMDIDGCFSDVRVVTTIDTDGSNDVFLIYN